VIVKSVLMSSCAESNEVLKLKFRKLHKTVIDSVNPASIIAILYPKEVISDIEMTTLGKLNNNPQQQSSELLALLHRSEHPQAFIQLFLAIKEEPQLKWLIEPIDNFTDQSLIAQRYISEPTGE